MAEIQRTQPKTYKKKRLLPLFSPTSTHSKYANPTAPEGTMIYNTNNNVMVDGGMQAEELKHLVHKATYKYQ